jgi:hypothetical protein
MEKWRWWLLVLFSGAFISTGIKVLLQFGNPVPRGIIIPGLMTALGAFGIFFAHKHRKESLSKLEWIVLIWFALAAIINAMQPLITSQSG